MGINTMASGNDMKAANSTYGGFTSLIKWGTIVSLLAAAVVVVVISS
jgi:hypothetical protein